MKKTNKEDLIYIAGLFDGDGCVEVVKLKVNDRISIRHWLRTHISNTNKTILLYFKKKFGGKLYNNQTAKKSHHTLCWNWTLTTNQALNFLEKVYPYLRIKRDVAKLGIKFQKNMKRFRFKKISQKELKRRENIFIKIKEIHSIK